MTTEMPPMEDSADPGNDVASALSETRLDIPFTAVNVITTALACVLPFFYYSRSSMIAFLVFYTVTGLGLTLGYHRLFAHKAFQVPKWLEHTIALCGYLAIQRGPIFWCAMHRMHHRHTDIPGRDPHTPNEGLLHVHFGWMQRRRRDVWEQVIYRRWTPDLMRDPFYVRLDDQRFDYFAYLLLVSLSYVAGGLVGAAFSPTGAFDRHNAMCFLVWVGVLNRVAILHAFGLINSACHIIGSRPYSTHGADSSVNNAVVAFLIFGEGWHNNHHAFPTSARQGLQWYQWDPAWYAIWLLTTVGLASNVQLPTELALQRAASKADGPLPTGSHSPR